LPPLISTIYSSPQHALSLFSACYIFTSRSLATALTVEVHQLPALTPFLQRLSYRTAFWLSTPELSAATDNCQLSRCHLFSIILQTANSGDSIISDWQFSTESHLTWDPRYITSGLLLRLVDSGNELKGRMCEYSAILRELGVEENIWSLFTYFIYLFKLQMGFYPVVVIL
jgi:hypothetical protein